MLLFNDKKKAAQLILGGPDGEMKEKPAVEMDANAGLEAAMQKFMNCMKNGDAKGCAAALGQYMDMYEMMEEPSEE